MDVWLNKHFPCKNLESSNWKNQLYMDVSGSSSYISLVGGWTKPFEQICSSNWIISPGTVRLKIKNDWNYHLEHKPYTYSIWKGDGTVPTYWFIRTLYSSTFWYLCHLFWPEGTWKRWWIHPFFVLALHHWLCAHLQQGPWQGLVGQVRRRRPWIAWRTLKKHRVPPCWNGCGLCFLEFGALLPWFFRHASWHMWTCFM